MADGQDNKNTASSDDIKNLLAQLKQSFNLAETSVPETSPEIPPLDEAEFEKLEKELQKEGLLQESGEEDEDIPDDTDSLPAIDTYEKSDEDLEDEPVLPLDDEQEEALAEEAEEALAEEAEEAVAEEFEEASEEDVGEEPMEEAEEELALALDILENTHKSEETESFEEEPVSFEEAPAEEETTPESVASIETDWESFLAKETAKTAEQEKAAEDVAPWDFQPEFLTAQTVDAPPASEPKTLPESLCEEASEEKTEEENENAVEEQVREDVEDQIPAETEDQIQAEIEVEQESDTAEKAENDVDDLLFFADIFRGEEAQPEREEPTEEAELPTDEAETPVAESEIPAEEPTSSVALPEEEVSKPLKETKPKEHWYVPDFMRIKERTDRFCDKNLLSLTIRFWASLIPTLLLLVFENYEIFGFDFVLFSNARTGIWVNLLLLACSAAAVLPELKNGVLALINRRTTSESFLAVSLTAVALYDVALLLLSIGNAAITPRLLALLPAFSVSLYLNTQRRYAHVRAASIHAISDEKPMNALVPQFANAVPDEKKVLGKLVYEDSLIARTREIRRVDGINSRLRAVCEDARPNNVLLIAAASLSFIAGLVMGIVEGSFEEGLLTFCFALALIIPGALVYTRISPVSRACRRALENGGVILGESSMYLYSELGAVSFEDISAFPASKVKVCKIKLFNRNPLDRVLYSASGVFSVLGGPLSGVFREAVTDIGTTGDVQILSVREDGVIARVDGVEMKIGTGAFMQKDGVELPFDAEDEMFLAGGKVSILYASFGNVPCAKFYLRYMLDRNFVKTIQALYKNGICTVIRTYDPNINNRLISKIGALNAFSVKVVHKTEEHLGDFVAPSADSGVLSHKDALGASGLLFLCINAVRILRSNVILKLAMAGISVAVFVFLQIIGFAGFDYSVTSVLYQLLWLIPILAASRLYIK